MKTAPTIQSSRPGPRLISHARALLAVSVLAALAMNSQAMANSLSFNPPSTVATLGSNNSAIVDKGVLGDFNGDGNLDLLVVRQFNYLSPANQIARILVFLGNGNGGIAAALPEYQPANSKNVVSVEAGDLNGDGRLDVVLVNSETHNVTVLLGNGNGTFADQAYSPGIGGPRYQGLGDLDGDGDLDIVVGNWGGAVSALPNNGNGSFGAPVIISGHLPGNPSRTDIEIGDVDGDGDNDVVASRVNGVDVYLNTGSLTFAGGEVFNTPTGQMLLHDFDGNGTLDIATPAGTGDAVRVHSGNGNGNFGAPALYPTGATGSFSISTADFNGDGIRDIATANNTTAGSVSVLLANGLGSFAPAVRFPVPASLILPQRLLVGDMNNDGKSDLLTLNKNSGPNAPYATVMLNTTNFAQMFFTDTLTGPTAPNLDAIPAGKYGYTAGGLQRTQSSGTTDRPMVTTALGTYLTALNFTAEITVNLTSPDLAYFGFGRADPDPINYFNEPTGNFLFRIHRNWGGTSGIQVWPTQFVPAFNDPSHFFGFADGGGLGNYGSGPLTFMIKRAGDSLTMSIPSLNVSHTFSISQYAGAMGLTNANTRIFFGNTSVGSVFSNLKIYETPSDTTPPDITAPADITTEATGPAGAVVSFAATANDDVDGPVSVLADPASGSTFPLGTTVVDLGAADSAGNIAMASFNVTVQDTTPPVITAPADLTVEATSAAGATATYALPGAEDIVSGSVAVAASQASGSTFSLGATSVGLTATDAAGNTATASFTVTVVDTTAPVISSLTPSSATLWPPNHQMVAIAVTAAATDAVGITSLKIVSVTSSEPDNGLGDGDTAGDIQITGDLTVNLRAERSGKGNGRIYTITVEAGDAAGNTSTLTCTVSVPKSQGKK